MINNFEFQIMLSPQPAQTQMHCQCFESALYLTPPQEYSITENSPSTMDSEEREMEKLINSDLLNEINKANRHTPFKDITFMALNSTPVSEKNEESTKRLFAFPDGGWVCSLCQNYNFYGRIKCNRCNKDKNKEDFVGKPKHLQRFDEPTSEKSGKKKHVILAEKAGDWVCAFCKNLNFAFRKQCNRCMKSKEEAQAIIHKVGN